MHPGCLGDRRRNAGNVIEIWIIWNKSAGTECQIYYYHISFVLHSLHIDWKLPAGRGAVVRTVTQLSIIKSQSYDKCPRTAGKLLIFNTNRK